MPTLPAPAPSRLRLMVFSKHLAGLPLEVVATRLRAMNIGAIDLTVRPKGHVEPARVADELPRVAQVLAAHGVAIGMMTTEITEPGPLAETVLRAAKSLGVGFFKLGYFGYEGFGSLRKSRNEARAKVRALSQMCAAIGIQGGFHNHSHNFIGASMGDIDFILQAADPSIGLYFDAAHASIEGGSSGWEMGLDLLSERLVMLAAKDYKWNEGPCYGGGRRSKVVWCPLQDGQTPWPQVLERLHALGFEGPASLHSEYQGSHSFRDLSTEQVLEQTALDAALLRHWMRGASVQEVQGEM